MRQPIRWSKNPELWAFRAKRLKLHAFVERSRLARFLIEKEFIEREYERLRARWAQLVKDGQFAKGKHDSGAMQRVANQIAAFYRDVGIVDGRVDSVLSRVAALNDVGLRTG